MRYGAEGAKAVTLKGDARVLALADARDKAQAILGRVADGEDPAGEKAAARRVRAEGADTFQSLAERLLLEADLADTTRRSWTWTLTKRVFPLLGDRPPADLTRPEVREAVARITERHGTSQGNEALKVVRWTLARALDADVISANPAAGIRKSGKEWPRDRVLSVAELRAVWNARERGRRLRPGRPTRGPDGRAPKRSLQSDMERGGPRGRSLALAGRAHEEPAPSRGAAHARHARRARRAARGRGGRAALRGRAVLEVLGGVARGRRHRGSEGRGREGLEVTPKRTRADRWPVRFHDLRRTFRNALTAELGVAPHVAEALVGHAESGLVRTYAPSGVPLADRRRALERWGRYVLAVAAGKRGDKVAEFPGRS